MSHRLRTVPWYDRNPISVVKTFDGTGLTPHASTQRWSYEVPKKRKAFVELISMNVIRILASTVLNEVESAILLLSQPDKSNLPIHRLYLIDKNVGASKKEVIHGSLTMTAGEILSAHDEDNNADGQCSISTFAKIVEFDAFPIEEPPFQPDLPPRDIQEPLKNMLEEILEGIRKLVGV